MTEWREYIVSDNQIVMGKPIIKGTRLTVDFIIQRFASGWTEEQILENYPRITKEHIKAVFAYLHDCMKEGLLFDAAIESA